MCPAAYAKTDGRHITCFFVKVSSAGWTRAELESLRSKVDARLATLQARPGAVCAVREQVFSELYDEIIREVSDNIPTR